MKNVIIQYRHNPNAADLHVNLAGVYERLNRIPDATTQYRKAVELAPDDFRANLLTGRLLGMHGDASAALPYLQKAVALDPNSPDDVYATLEANGKVTCTCRGTFVAVKEGHPAYHRW